MEILKIDLTRLRNEEHLNYHSEVNELVIRFTVDALKIQGTYPAFELALKKEGEALQFVRKSMYTGPIADDDKRRDTIFRGFRDTVEGACNHFNPVIAKAAQRLKIVLDSFGNISIKSYDQQTAANKALVNDLETTYAKDVADVGVTEWVSELKARNIVFEALVAERYTHESGKTQVKMKTARKNLDAAYHTITSLVNALVLVEGPETWKTFILELNMRIEKYNMRLNQREGRNKDLQQEEE